MTIQTRPLQLLTLGFLLLFQSFTAQTKTGKKEIFNKDFNWTITIPENFENVPPEQWAKMQSRGQEAIEETYEQKVENHAKTIFVFNSDQFNYFESNYQPFDPETDGNYDEVFVEVNKIVFATFQAQMPDAKLDSISSREKIDGLTFNKFHATIELPNKMVMELLMYSRLFGKQEFTVSIMTVDKEKQKVLLEAWTNSKFKK